MTVPLLLAELLLFLRKREKRVLTLLRSDDNINKLTAFRMPKYDRYFTAACRKEKNVDKYNDMC